MRKEESVEPLLLFQVLLFCRDTRHKNGDEFVVFIDERAALVKRLDQRERGHLCGTTRAAGEVTCVDTNASG